MQATMSGRRNICSLLLLAAAISAVSAQQNADVRLVGGDTSAEGRVEVFYDGTWGTICDDSWHLRDANVVCQQLGFEKAERVWFRAEFGEGTGPIWLDQMNCNGGESSVLECGHNGWGVHDCQHREDASVRCSRPAVVKPRSLPVRLSCPKYVQNGTCNTCPDKQHPAPTDCAVNQPAVEGIVEVFHGEVWRPVLGDRWSIEASRVVCGELGYPVAFSPPALSVLWANWNGHYLSGCDSGSGGDSADPNCDSFHAVENDAFRQRLRSALLNDLECSGKESQLLSCYFGGVGVVDNPSMEVATVKCGFFPHSGCFSGNAEIYRLRGGAVPWKGRVEVRVSNEWRTICDVGWDEKAANIVCRSLGYGTARKVLYRSAMGRGVGTIQYTSLRCTGSELSLSRCQHQTGRVAQDCGHRGDATVECNAPFNPYCNQHTMRVRHVESEDLPGYFENYVEVRGIRGWGLLCQGMAHPPLPINAANVLCREHLQLFAARVGKLTLKNYVGAYYRGRVICSGEEMSIKECTSIILPTTSCTEQAVLYCTAGLPDLVPDLRVFESSISYYPYIDRLPMYYLRCAQEEGCLSSSAEGQDSSSYRSLLRFNSQTMNYGTADFRPVLSRSDWIWHSCHNHFHSFEAFIHYDLLDIATGSKVAEGHKASFCLEDSICDSGSGRFRCGTGTQGISMNCGDLYGRHLDCQWIDVTDVSPGVYLLRQQVNPDRLVPETDYLNNEVTCRVQIFPGYFLYSSNCKLSDH